MANCSKEYSAELVKKYGDAVYNEIQNIEFPKLREKPITEQSCINEIKSMCRYDKSDKTLSSIIRKFHKSLIYANRTKHPSPYEGWQEIKNNKDKFLKFYENRLRCSDWFNEKNGKNRHKLDEGYVPEFIFGIGLTTSGKYPLVSYFKPQLAKRLVMEYLSEYDTVFDPFSGYSGRMIGTLAAGKNYIGHDLCKSSIEESKEIYNFIKPYIQIYYDKEPMCTLEIADAAKTTGKYDALLTCSPYGDIENWPGVETSTRDCDDWIDVCLQNYDCKKYVFVTDNTIKRYINYVDDELENTSHWGSNKEFIVVITKEQRDEIIRDL